MRNIVTHQFNIKDKLFELEFLEFVVDGKQIAHIEFHQIIDGEKIQTISDNLNTKEIFRTFKYIIFECHKRYKSYDISLFSSIDGNLKRERIYKAIAKNSAKTFQRKFQAHKTHINSAIIYLLSVNDISSELLYSITDYLDCNGYLKL